MGTTADKLSAVIDAKADISAGWVNLQNNCPLKYFTTRGMDTSLPEKFSDWGSALSNVFDTLSNDGWVGWNIMNYEWYFRWGVPYNSTYTGTDSYNSWPVKHVKMIVNSVSEGGMYGAFNKSPHLNDFALSITTGYYNNSFRETCWNCTNLSSAELSIGTFQPSIGSSAFRHTFGGSSSHNLKNFTLHFPSKWNNPTYTEWQQGMLLRASNGEKYTIAGIQEISVTNSSEYYFLGGNTNNWLSGYGTITNLSIDFPDLKVVRNTGNISAGTLALLPSSLGYVKQVTFPELSALDVCTAEDSKGGAFGSWFYTTAPGNVYIRDVYLPKCVSIGRCALNGLQTRNGAVHFAAENQATIEALPGYENKFQNPSYLKNNLSIMFDL